MAPSVDRRGFVKASACAAAGIGLGAGLVRAQAPGSQAQAQALQGQPRPPAPPSSSLDFKTKLQKALIARPSDDLKPIKDAGFDGVEAREVTPDTAAKMREAAEKIGLRVHSVLYGWAEFNSPDKSEVERTFAESQAALRAARVLGADTVLLVPCRIGARRAPGAAGSSAAPQAPTMRIPRAWEFQIEFDPKNGHLSRVVHGDNAPYADYIAAHNHATDTSVEWVKRLIPLAEETKVVIALENVGNNLWVKPDLFAHFVRSFRSPWVKAYFDIANHERFARAEEWILALDDLLAKVHVKDYLLDPADPDGRGRGVNIREGGVRWPVVRQALEAVDYSGWMTIEGSDSLSMEERNRRLDLIVQGR